jgi:prepilin-type N-terminal cleavage/methylation domain-containing protein
MKKYFTGREQRGFTLLETLIAVMIMSIVAAAAFGAIGVATKARLEADVRTTARSIGVSQMEAVQAGSYKNAPSAGVSDYGLPVLPAGYSLFSLGRDGVTLLADKIYGVPWDITTNTVYIIPSPVDPGIQKITLIVEFNGNEIIRLTDFKVNR